MSGTIEKSGLTGYETQAVAVADAAEGEAPIAPAPVLTEELPVKKPKKDPNYTNKNVAFEGDYGLVWDSTSGFVLEHSTTAILAPNNPKAPKLYFEESGSGSLSDPDSFSGAFKAGPRFGNWNFLVGYLQSPEPVASEDLNGDGAVDDADKPQKDEPFIGTLEYVIIDQKKKLDKPNLKAGLDLTGVEMRNLKIYAKGWQPVLRNLYLPYSFAWTSTRTDSNASLFGEALGADEGVKISHKIEAGASALVHFEDSELVSKYAFEFGAKYTHQRTETNATNTDEDPYADYVPESNTLKLTVNQYLPFGEELSRDQIVSRQTPLTVGVSYEIGQNVNLGPWQGNGVEGYSEPTRNLSDTPSYREELPAVTSKLGLNVTWNILSIDVNAFPQQLDTTGSVLLIGASASTALDLTGQMAPFEEKSVGFQVRLVPSISKKKPEPKK